MVRPDVAPINTPNAGLDARLAGGDGSVVVAPVVAPAAPVVPVVAPVVPVVAPVAPVVPVVAPAAVVPAVAPVTPVVAPVIPAVTPAPGVQLPIPEAKPAVKWEATGNAELDALGGLFEEKNFDGATLLSEFTQHGEISQETFDAMSKELGAPTAALVHQQFDSAMGALKQSAEKSAGEIHEAVGGVEQWGAVAEWSKSLPDAERVEYNKLLKTGGVAAVLAAKSLQGKMMSDPTFKARADLLGGGATPVAGAAPVAGVMLDRATYSEKIRLAEQQGNMQVMQQLRAAAKFGMKNNPNWKVGNPK